MSWTKTETVTQSPDAQGDKVIAESWAINDRDGNAVLTVAQDGTGVKSMTFAGTINASENGTVVGTGVSGAESIGAVRKTVLTLDDVAVAMTDEAGVVAFGGAQIYTFPAGVINVLGATANLAVTQSSTQVETATVIAAAGCTGNGDLIVTVTAGSGLPGSPIDVTVPLTTAANSATLVAAEIRAALNANTVIAARYTIGGSGAAVTLTKTHTDGPDSSWNIDINADDAGTTATGITNAATSSNTTTGIAAAWDGDFGIGTVTAGNNNALATTEQNILPTTSTPQATAGVTTAKGQNAAAAYLDGTTTPIDMFLNFLIDDADQDIDATSASLIVNGTVTVTWLNLGDY